MSSCESADDIIRSQRFEQAVDANNVDEFKTNLRILKAFVTSRLELEEQEAEDDSDDSAFIRRGRRRALSARNALLAEGLHLHDPHEKIVPHKSVDPSLIVPCTVYRAIGKRVLDGHAVFGEKFTVGAKVMRELSHQLTVILDKYHRKVLTKPMEWLLDDPLFIERRRVDEANKQAMLDATAARHSDMERKMWIAMNCDSYKEENKHRVVGAEELQVYAEMVAEKYDNGNLDGKVVLPKAAQPAPAPAPAPASNGELEAFERLKFEIDELDREERALEEAAKAEIVQEKVEEEPEMLLTLESVNRKRQRVVDDDSDSSDDEDMLEHGGSAGALVIASPIEAGIVRAKRQRRDTTPQKAVVDHNKSATAGGFEKLCRDESGSKLLQLILSHVDTETRFFKLPLVCKSFYVEAWRGTCESVDYTISYGPGAHLRPFETFMEYVKWARFMEHQHKTLEKILVTFKRTIRCVRIVAQMTHTISLVKSSDTSAAVVAASESNAHYNSVKGIRALHKKLRKRFPKAHAKYVERTNFIDTLRAVDTNGVTQRYQRCVYAYDPFLVGLVAKHWPDNLQVLQVPVYTPEPLPHFEGGGEEIAELQEHARAKVAVPPEVGQLRKLAYSDVNPDITHELLDTDINWWITLAATKNGGALKHLALENASRYLATTVEQEQIYSAFQEAVAEAAHQLPLDSEMPSSAPEHRQALHHALSVNLDSLALTGLRVPTFPMHRVRRAETLCLLQCVLEKKRATTTEDEEKYLYNDITPLSKYKKYSAYHYATTEGAAAQPREWGSGTPAPLISDYAQHNEHSDRHVDFDYEATGNDMVRAVHEHDGQYLALDTGEPEPPTANKPLDLKRALGVTSGLLQCAIGHIVISHVATGSSRLRSVRGVVIPCACMNRYASNISGPMGREVEGCSGITYMPSREMLAHPTVKSIAIDSGLDTHNNRAQRFLPRTMYAYGFTRAENQHSAFVAATEERRYACRQEQMRFGGAVRSGDWLQFAPPPYHKFARYANDDSTVVPVYASLLESKSSLRDENLSVPDLFLRHGKHPRKCMASNFYNDTDTVMRADKYQLYTRPSSTEAHDRAKQFYAQLPVLLGTVPSDQSLVARQETFCTVAAETFGFNKKVLEEGCDKKKGRDHSMEVALGALLMRRRSTLDTYLHNVALYDRNVRAAAEAALVDEDELDSDDATGVAAQEWNETLCRM